MGGGHLIDQKHVGDEDHGESRQERNFGGLGGESSMGAKIQPRNEGGQLARAEHRLRLDPGSCNSPGMKMCKRRKGRIQMPHQSKGLHARGGEFATASERNKVALREVPKSNRRHAQNEVTKSIRTLDPPNVGGPPESPRVRPFLKKDSDPRNR